MTRLKALAYVASCIEDDSPIQAVLGLFYAWCPCDACGQGGACEHRDRRKDLEEILAARVDLCRVGGDSA